MSERHSWTRKMNLAERRIWWECDKCGVKSRSKDEVAPCEHVESNGAKP